METTTRPQPLTYTENGRTYNVICAVCTESGIETLATAIVPSGRPGIEYPMCSDCHDRSPV